MALVSPEEYARQAVDKNGLTPPQGSPENTGSFWRETAKAIPRVAGGMAEGLAKTVQGAQGLLNDSVSPYATQNPDLVKNIRQEGEKLQQSYAMTPEFQAAHPVASKIGTLAEGVASSLPALAAASAVGALGGPPGEAAALGGMFGLKKFQEEREAAQAKGMTPEESRQAAYAPAATEAVTMGALAPVGAAVSKFAAPAAETAGKVLTQGWRQPVASGLAEAGVLTSGTAATAQAEKQTGIRPEAQPLKEAFSMENLASNALMVGAFKGVHAVQGMKIFSGMRNALENPDTPAEQRMAVAAHVENQIRQSGVPDAKVKADEFKKTSEEAILGDTPKPIPLDAAPMEQVFHEALAKKIAEPESDLMENISGHEALKEKVSPFESVSNEEAAKANEQAAYKLPEENATFVGPDGQTYTEAKHFGDKITGFLNGTDTPKTFDVSDFKETPNAVNEGIVGEGQGHELQGAEQGNVKEGAHRNITTPGEQGGSAGADRGNNVIEGAGKEITPIQPGEAIPEGEVKPLAAGELRTVAGNENLKIGRSPEGDKVRLVGKDARGETTVLGEVSIDKNGKMGEPDIFPQATGRGAVEETRFITKTLQDAVEGRKAGEAKLEMGEGKEAARLSTKNPEMEVKEQPVYQEKRNVAMGTEDSQFVAREKGKELGRIWITKVPGGFEVRKVEVAKDAAGRGVAERLYAEAVDQTGGVWKGSTAQTTDAEAAMKTPGMRGGKGLVETLRKNHPEWFGGKAEAEVETKGFGSAKNAVDFTTEVNKAFGTDHVFKQVDAPNEKLAGAVAKALGKELVFMEQKGGKTVPMNGMVLNDDRIFILKGSSKDFVTGTVLHEAFHQLEKDYPELYNQLAKDLGSQVTGLKGFSENLNAKRTKAGMDPLSLRDSAREMISDIAHDQAYQKGFWDKLAQKAPDAFKRVYDFVTDLIQRIKEGLGVKGGRGMNQYLVNAEKVQQIMADTMAKYMHLVEGKNPQEFAQEWKAAAEMKPELAKPTEPFYSKAESIADERTFPAEFVKGKDVGLASKPERIIQTPKGEVRIPAVTGKQVKGKSAWELLSEYMKANHATEDEITQTFGDLKGKEKITKADVLESIRANSVELKDVVLGQAKMKFGPNTHSDLWLPGGTNQKTLFVTAPGAGRSKMWSKEEYLRNVSNVPSGSQERFYQSYVENFAKNAQREEGWKEQHGAFSDIENPVVRVDMEDRTVGDKKILFINEMQGPGGEGEKQMPEYLQKRIYDLGVKRVLAYAKENEYDGVSWPAGEMVAKRYDLSKHVESIKAEPYLPGETDRFNMTIYGKDGNPIYTGAMLAEDLPNYVGKELAQKIVDNNGGDFSGLDLKVGGEGLKDTYDKRLPALFKKYGKGEVGETAIQTPSKEAAQGSGAWENERIQLQREFDRQGRAVTDTNLRYTPEFMAELNKKLKVTPEQKVPIFNLTPATPESYPKFQLTTPQAVAESLKKDKFISEDVIPKITAAVSNIKQVGDQFLKGFAPGSRGAGDAAKTQDEFREVLGKMWQKQYQVASKVDELMKSIEGKSSTISSVLDTMRSQGKTLADNYFARLPKEEKWDFIYRANGEVSPDGIRRKIPQPDATRQALDDFMTKMFNDRVDAIHLLRTGLLQNVDTSEGGEGNPYFPPYWDKPVGDAQKAINIAVSKRPIDGQKAFAHARVFDDIYEGMKLGYKLVSDNPMDLFFMKIVEMDKYIAAHTMLQSLEGQDIAHLRPTDEFLPAGEINILGTFGRVKREDPETGEMKSYKYGVREDVAQVINNYLSPSLYNNPIVGKAFSGWMSAANHLNQMQLGVGSLFHAGFTSIETVTSHVSTGLMKLSTGDVLGAVKMFAEAPLMIVKSPMIGNQIMSAYAGGKVSDPMIANMPMIVEGLAMAGARKGMDTRLQTHVTEDMFSAWSSGNKVGAVLRSPFAAVEQLARPLLEWLVPRQKFAVFGERYNYWLDEHPNAAYEDRRTAAGHIWNRVDSILGQVNYDRLFVNNTAKNILQATLRAPGWTGGTLLELGGGFKDAATAMMDIAHGKKPVLTDRTAYVLSLIITTSVINGIMTTLFTGEQPEGKDFIAFRTGNTDENGFPERFMLPTYMKDIWAYANSTSQTLVNKLHPAIGMVREGVENKDYYGVEIRHEGDNIAAQLGQLLGFGIKQYTPFWVRGVQKEQERGGSEMAQMGPLLGLMPAPSEMNRTPAERMTREFMKERAPSMTKTEAEADRSKKVRQLTKAMRTGDPTAQEQIQTAVSNGEISTQSARLIQSEAKLSPLQAGFKRLGLDEATKIISIATPAEKEQLNNIYKQKQARWKQQYPHGEAGTESAPNTTLSQEANPNPTGMMTPEQQMVNNELFK
jgi:GNAT superfamily N-acetyltransferase